VGDEMIKRTLLLGLTVFVAGCIRSLWHPAASVEDDPSIIFPEFFDQAPVAVGGNEGVFELDGPTMRALAVAANDLLPIRDNLPCIDKQEAHLYRVVRRGGIIFVRIDENPAYCGRKYPRLDSGAQYAISTDGRILRHVIDGTEVYTSSGRGIVGAPAPPGVSPSFDPERMNAPAFLLKSHDGGVSPEKETPPAPPSPADGGAPLSPDAG
jgi:hypothetical protein